MKNLSCMITVLAMFITSPNQLGAMDHQNGGQSFTSEGQEIRELLKTKGVDLGQILTKMGLGHQNVAVVADDRIYDLAATQPCSGPSIHVNKKFVEGLTAPELTYLFGHEATHLVNWKKDGQRQGFVEKVIAGSFLGCMGAISYGLWRAPLPWYTKMLLGLGSLVPTGAAHARALAHLTAYRNEYEADAQAVRVLGCGDAAIQLLKDSMDYEEECKARLRSNPDDKDAKRAVMSFRIGLISHPSNASRIVNIQKVMQQIDRSKKA